MEQLLAHLVADIDRWEEQDEISAHAAADLRHYVGRIVVEHEQAA